MATEIKSGYFKKRLDVDLTRNHCERQPLRDEFLERFVGGRGFGAKLVWDHLVAHQFQIDPLGPENLVVIAPGPLTGTYVPSSGKCSFVSISPATGIYADSNVGGTFGVELRQTGVDLVAVVGRAPELSILLIDDDETRVLPMPDLAGKTALEAEGLIKDRLGTHEVKVAVIGPAGENRVRIAGVNSDWSRNAGRTGMGAVLGAKNLKALVVRGSKDLPIFDVHGLLVEAEKAFAYMRNHKYFRMWQREGLMMVMQYASAVGILPTYNFKDATYPKVKHIDGDTMLANYKIGDSACYTCSMSCGNICLVRTGRYVGTVTEGPEYESCAMLGSNLGVDNYAAVLHFNKTCDELGLDAISAGSLVGAVIEGYEKGILTLEDLGGRPIAWGDEEGIDLLLHKIARREGIGDTLADGSKAVLRRWPAMEQVLVQVKGLEQSAYDSRAAASMALAYATSDTGAHHSRAWTIAKEIEQGAHWSDEEKVDLVIYHQSVRPLFDMLGVCRLPWIELGLNEQHYAAFYSRITGARTTLADLLDRSRAVYDLTRLISVRLGVSRKDDSLPYKVRACPIQTGPTAGRFIDPQHFERLLDLYYRKRGWDKDGIPPPEVAERFM